MTAVHIVINAVFQRRFSGVSIYCIKIYHLFCRYLNLGVSFDIVNEPSILNFVIFLPLIIQTEFIVPHCDPFEKEDFI